MSHKGDTAITLSTLASDSGYFELRDIDTGSYLLEITFQGFEPFRKAISLSAERLLVDLSIIKMQPAAKLMQEVIIRDEVPIRVKGDTISFNANSFKTKPNATAEDLLKKLPGMQVDKEGSVKAKGETVQKIYVDGKEFFGNDPAMATKNLSADMIDRVELFDDVSEQSKFNGVDDGSRSKAINLKLKNDKKKGMFGKASAGYGSDEHYQNSLTANYFKGAKKLSIIARANNTNNIGFSSTGTSGMANIMGNGSANARRNASVPGITNNWMAGLNYSNILGKKVELAGSYTFNSTDNNNVSSSYRKAFFPDSTVTRNTGRISENRSDNHRVSLRINYVIDTMNTIVYTVRAGLQKGDVRRVDTTGSFAESGSLSRKVNDSHSSVQENGEASNWNSNLLYRHRFSKARRTLSIDVTNGINDNSRNGVSNSRIGQYESGVRTGQKTIDQRSTLANNTTTNGVAFSFTEPIGTGNILEFNYSYNNSRSKSDRTVYDVNDSTGKHDLKNLQQTSFFENRNQHNRFGTNFQVVRKNFNYQLGLGVQRTLLQSSDASKSALLAQHFTNLFPAASLSYQIGRSKNLRLQYRGSTNSPGTFQLQEVVVKDNPLYWTRGNAALTQEYTNNLSLAYTSFDANTFRSLFFVMNFFNTYNKIVNNIVSRPDLIRQVALLRSADTIPQGVQLSTPVNADGVYFVNGNLSLGFPINNGMGGGFNATTTASLNRNVSFADGVRNFTNELTLGEEFRLNVNVKEKLDAGISVSANYSSIKNTLQKSHYQNSSYCAYTASADISYTLPANFMLSTDFDYTTNSGLSSGFNQRYFLWNASLSKQVFKNKKGELKFYVNDILNQNTNVLRTTADNYIEDTRNLTIRRFAMLMFAYNLARRNAPVREVK